MGLIQPELHVKNSKGLSCVKFPPDSASLSELQHSSCKGEVMVVCCRHEVQIPGTIMLTFTQKEAPHVTDAASLPFCRGFAK